MQDSNQLTQTPVIILCGGKGVMLHETQNARTNKALVRVQDKPLFYWVMKSYALHGANEFILAVGFQAELFGPELLAIGAKAVQGSLNQYIFVFGERVCRLQLVITHPALSTGGRLLACRSTLEALGEREQFAVTYSDTLSDIDLGAEMRCHKKQGKIATMVAAKLPVRFRVLGIRASEILVRGFAARPVIEGASINGGYYIFSPEFWHAADTLTPKVALEEEPLEQLAAAGQLVAYEHKGAWQTCDAERDLLELNRLACLFANQS